jgi:endonuclease G
MRRSDLKNKAAIQAAIRQVANEYLPDPNINSVGIGYKHAEGKRTDALALQFAVDRKLAPESLESAETRSIPESITANGIKFLTDVVERDFQPNPTATTRSPKADRKSRLDPMVPGISISHPDGSAGTLGCLVRDRESGRVRILSNWHVLHGPTGEIGDPLVQPGPYDDNRSAVNRCGTLERSFLGLAGDCALGSVSGRGIDPKILGLGVTVRAIVDPELGDRVVKSGRTTSVTYGVVTRVHTISDMPYREIGNQQIGGFEIGPDDQHPAEDGEISMGGDSGSAWLSVAPDGTTADVIVGLHFAGETTGPQEFAMACYATSVFDKLEIDPLAVSTGSLATAIDVAVETVSTGFDVDFLPGHRLALPAAAKPAIARDYAPTRMGEKVRHYTHFSLAMSASRRFCRWAAWNIDGTALRKLSRAQMRFRLDDAYDEEHQVGDELYARPANSLDRGHVARRADLIWGREHEADRANIDSFFFTNIVPQLNDFNRSSSHGLWGQLENAIYEDLEIDRLRASVFGGPVFKQGDFAYRNVLIPRSFWKLIAYVQNERLKASAYMLTQDDLEERLEAIGLEPFKLYQVAVDQLSEATGLTFGGLSEADTMRVRPEMADGRRVRKITERSELAAN